MIRTYRNLPDVPTGYPLDDVWSVVVPVQRTNLVSNPSFETNTTSWAAIGGSVARSTAQQYHGAYSLAITPGVGTTDGARFDTVALITGTTYAYSAKVRGVAGLRYKLCVETTGGVELNSVTFIASGRWQWVSGYYAETSTITRRLTVRKAGHASVAAIYLDGVQVEAIVAGETVSTYLDGDQIGLVPNQIAYYWTGTPHASASVRSGLTRAGGMVIPFRKYGFLLTAIIGLGLAAPQNAATEYARIDGGYDSYTRKPTRQFTLTGRFQGTTYRQLRERRGDLADLFDRDLTAQDQRLLLLRHVEGANGVITTQTARLYAKYQGGLQGNTDNMHAETVPITFTQYLPTVLSDAESGAALAVQQSLANANYFVKRSPAGVWSVPGGGTGSATAMVAGLDGMVYIAGTFADWNANAASDNIVKYNPTTGTYAPLSTGTNGSVSALAVLPNGKIVIGGSFTLAGGVANTARIAVYDPVLDTFAALGTGASTNSVLSLAVDSAGGIYAGGDYALMGGVANTLRVAYWTGSAWTALSTGANGTVYGLAMGLDGALYLTGGFTTLGAVSANQIGKWSGGAFTPLSTGVNGSGGRALVVAPNGTVYVGGLFTLAGGIGGTGRVAAWNGVAFQGLGGGLGGDVYDLSVNSQGVLLAAGAFAAPANGAGFSDGVAIFNGSSWIPVGVDTPAISGQINAVLATNDGALYLGYSGIGTATTEAVTALVNTGTAKAAPAITVTGPTTGTARVYSLINYTTNRAIYFSLIINAGEVVTLTLQPDAISFTSSFGGNIMSKIMPGSQVADWFLQPGANNIAFFAASATVTVTITWRPAYASLDDVP